MVMLPMAVTSPQDRKGDNMTFELHYTGIGYPSMTEIEAEAKKKGFTHSYWASEYGFEAFYNGDTVVVYNSTDDMSQAMRADAERFGRPIA